jgi:hypothetical protein
VSTSNGQVRFQPGDRVHAADRDNYGTIIDDDGNPKIPVHFVSPEGHEATVRLPRDQLTLAGQGRAGSFPSEEGRSAPRSQAPAITARDHWLLARSLSGDTLNGDAETASETIRPLIERLESEPLATRSLPWEGWLCGRADRETLIQRIADQDPNGPPPPEEDKPERCATLADVRRLIASTAWPWPGWLAGGVLNGLASDPGVGKTIMAMALAEILWFGRPWPDGQANPFAPGTKTLWVPGDRHFTQLLDLAAQYGLPDEAILFNAPDCDPTGGLDLDDTAYLESLKAWIEEEKPGLVIVDTVGMTTGRNLCKPEDARKYFGPLMGIANETTVPFLLLTHLSKDDNPLGRRIVGACRVVWKLATPDTEGQSNRRRLWVDKSYTLKPSPLGMTISDQGSSFDSCPPSKSGPPRGNSQKLEACKQWLKERLLLNSSRVSEVRTDAEKADYSAGILYKAKDALEVVEEVIANRKWWSLPVGPVSVVPDNESDNSDKP